MELNNAERLMLTMFSEIHAALKIKGGINALVIKEAINSDQLCALDWYFNGHYG